MGAGQVGGGQIYVQYTISYLDAYLKDIGQMFLLNLIKKYPIYITIPTSTDTMFCKQVDTNYWQFNVKTTIFASHEIDELFYHPIFGFRRNLSVSIRKKSREDKG